MQIGGSFAVPTIGAEATFAGIGHLCRVSWNNPALRMHVPDPRAPRRGGHPSSPAWEQRPLVDQTRPLHP
jgi:hypothetical protein